MNIETEVKRRHKLRLAAKTKWELHTLARLSADYGIPKTTLQEAMAGRLKSTVLSESKLEECRKRYKYGKEQEKIARANGKIKTCQELKIGSHRYDAIISGANIKSDCPVRKFLTMRLVA